jgi:hypothetical protein
MPPRSTLSRLEPIGIGTPYVESLSSYFLRLSHVHHVTPRVLGSYLGKQCHGLDFDNSEFFKPRFNGVGTIPEHWTKALESMTHQTNLSNLSLLRLRSLLPIRNLMSPKKRWCPICYIENKSAAYDCLIWDIAAVTTCPKHRVKLVESCTCSKDNRIHLTKTKRLPGICMLCGGKLGETSASLVQNGDDDENQRSHMIADFIANIPIEDKFIHEKLYLQFLTRIIERHFNGNASKFIKLVHLSPSKLSEYLHENHNPPFTAILNIAQSCKCSIWDVYLGNYQKVTEISENKQPLGIYRFSKRHHGPWKSINASTLQSVLEKEPTSLRQVARNLDVSTPFLVKYFPDLTKRITRRYRDAKKLEIRKRENERREYYRIIAHDIIRCGGRLSSRAIAFRMKDNYMVRTFKERRIICQVIREFIDLPQHCSQIPSGVEH